MSVKVEMPQLTDTMMEGVVSFWNKNVGDSILVDEPLVVVETDKAAVEILAEASGVLLNIFAAEGQTVKVGEVIAIIGEEGEDIEAQSVNKQDGVKKELTGQKGKRKRISNKIVASPVAKRMAKENNIDLNEVIGTGKDGLISKKDIELYIKCQNEPVENIVPLTGMRKVMFNSMTASASIPQVTTVAQADLSDLLLLSKEIAITITSFVVRAVVESIRNFPLINAVLEGDKIIIKENYNIGVAASTPKGLAVPVIHQAQDKSLIHISKELADLANKAKENKLTLENLANKTFTVTNSGVFGSIFFTPRVTPPELAILGIGKINKQPVVINDGIHIRSMMYLCLSYDHRIIDGETAVKFLQEVRKHLESPKETLCNRSKEM